MYSENTFKLSRHAVIALAIATAFPVTALAAAGRVEFAIGGATAIAANGTARPLAKGVEINSGDTIKTTDGRVQVRFTDGGYMSFQPNTEFRIENYSYDGQQDGSERGFFRLVEGGLRAITGLVGRQNRPAYRVATPVATIGIRGSEYVADYNDNDGKLRTRVIGGSIFIENEHGDLILFKGQSAEAGQGERPGYSEEESGVQAKGPEGGGPQQGEDQAREEQQLASVFTVNEQYTEDGTSCALTQSCGSDLSQVLASYAAANAYGVYSGSSSKALGNGHTMNASGDLYVSFGDYSIVNYLELTAINNTSGGYTMGYASFIGSGGFDRNGNIAISLEMASSYYDLCSGSCSVTGTGAFHGPAATSATINYSVSNISSSIVSSGNADVTVPYDGVVMPSSGSSEGEGEGEGIGI